MELLQPLLDALKPIFLIVIFISLLAYGLSIWKSAAVSYPYRRIELLFSAAERSMLGVLDKAVGDKARVFGKVRLADVISVKKGLRKSAWHKAFNRINRKHLDFVVCDPDSLRILCAVELNDRSHKKSKRIKRDNLVVATCEAAGIPLLMIDANKGYNIDEIRGLIEPYFTATQAPSLVK